MTVIDRYITNNPKKSTRELAIEIGVTESFVKCRRTIINDNDHVRMSTNTSDEIHALEHYISIKGSGWFVDAAKTRIAQLEATAKRI
ncbi:hypothetical protein [Mucilaginibacter endophyticus]|uniref:hypothetical protein n=1 Tax=Mucilaginibacter endophyticus TaxID=2675003 RepID=UPI0012B17F03|nr:hypothetical protein [Mucilaginibacter endophyticus]